MSITSSPNTTATSTAPANINPEQAVSFAALILADENLVITPGKLQTLLKAAGITEIEPIWTTLFANALKSKNVKDILTAVDTSGPKAGSDDAASTSRSDEVDKDMSEVDGIDIDFGSDSDDEMGTMGLFD